MTEPVSSILFGWAIGKVADTLWGRASGEIQERLKKTDLEAAIESGKQAIQSWEALQSPDQHLFFSSEPKKAQDYLTQAFTDSAVQGELQRPLKQDGDRPQLEIVCAMFQQLANPDLKLKLDRLKPWLEVFLAAYVARTSYFVKVRVAQQDYLTQLANWFDDVRFLGVAVESGEIEQAEKLAQIFVMQDVLEERSTFGGDFFLRFSDGDDPSGISSAARQSQLLQEQQFRSQLDRTGRRFSADQLRTQNRYPSGSASRSKAVLLGAPGSGKTTLMSYFAVTLAREAIAKATSAHAEAMQANPKAMRGNAKAMQADTEAMQASTEGMRSDAEGLQGETKEMLLPILIRIRDWALHPEMSIAEFARFHAEKTMSVKPLPAGFFEYWLDRGQALILLDGLDEVVEETKRSHLVQCIENFLGQYKANRAIVTSRPAGYRRDFFRTEEFPHYELQPFNDEQMNLFIGKWYDSRVPDQAEAERRKDSLKKAFEGNDRIKLLARNPLLLTIVALIHRYQAVLPKQRHKLYDKAVETLLLNWDRNKELTNHEALKYLELDDLRRLMECVAYWVHSQGNTGDREGGTVIDRDELYQQLSRMIKQQKSIELYQARKEAKRFLEFICDRTGLLNEQGQECYAFVHKTFQEYLTAQEINYQRDNEDFEIVLTHIETHLHDPHWREVLLLTIAQQAPKKAALAIRKILNANSPYEQWLHRDLLFAGRCLAENVKGLKAADSKLSSEILLPLLELEVSNDDQIGWEIRDQVLQILCSFNETEFEAEALQLIKAKVDATEEYRLQQYRVELGEKAAVVAELLQRIEDDDSSVRRSAARALGWLRSATEAVVQALMQRIEDDDSSVRQSAARALGNLRSIPEAVIQALVQRLEDEDSEVRLNAVTSLGGLRSATEAVIQALMQRLEDEEANVRWEVVWALGSLGSATEVVIEALMQRLEDEKAGVRSMAATSLSWLRSATEAVIQALMQRLKDENLGVRLSAASALGSLGSATEEVVQVLVQCLEDKDSSARASAAWALSNLRSATEAVIQALMQRLEDENLHVRSNTAFTLGKLGKTNASIQPLIIQWIEQHQDSGYVGDAIDALWQIVEG